MEPPASDEKNPAALPAHVGPYRVLSLLGAGGMGVVYRAHDTQLDRDVAVKTLPPEFARRTEWLARLRLEARTLAALNHPNIAAIYDLENAEGVTCLVLELVEGETLSGPLPLTQAVDYALQIADALETAHAKGIVHRDLKPANVKVTPQGRVKVLDFGLAKAIAVAGESCRTAVRAVAAGLDSAAPVPLEGTNGVGRSPVRHATYALVFCPLCVIVIQA